MRPLLALASALALVALAPSASALEYEPNNVETPPNGLLVPINSGPSEVQLNAFFTSRGEGIDWINDAHTTPNAFSPVCGFTATYVLNQAGSQFGLAWYNETGTAPLATDLHILVPAGSAVGTMFTGTSIQSDPAYLGGTVGFALMGGETHYTNDAYGTVCTDTSVCNPAGPWITALIYASTVTPNAFYVAFEDGGTSADGWNNDGDFNDDVFFVTGIECLGGGQLCDTGLPGICADGITQCAATGTTCQQVSQPTTETCNGLDDNCDGMVDNGAICPTGKVCLQGSCVGSCGAVAPCPSGRVCSSGYCVETSCVGVTCPSGQVCAEGTCKAPCDGITCPNGEVCRVGACVDPCAGVTCGANEVCTQGVCTTTCNCLPCASGTTCNTTSGQCVAAACATVTCDAGAYCASGSCVDDCAGAVCPTGQACQAGACVNLPDAGKDAGGSDAAGDAATTSNDAGHKDATAADAHSSADAGHAKGSDAGEHADAGHGKDAGHVGSEAAQGDGGSGAAGSSSGCGCRVAKESRGGRTGLWALGLLGIALARRGARRAVKGRRVRGSDVRARG